MRNSQNSVTTTITTTKPDNLILKWAKSLHSHFYKDTQMNNIHGNVLSITIREMQINTTMRYHLTPVQMTSIKKTRGSKCWWGCGKKELLCTVNVNINRYSHKEKQYRDSTKIKNKLPYDLTIPILDIYPKEMRSVSQKYLYCYLYLQYYSQQPKYRNVRVYQWING